MRRILIIAGIALILAVGVIWWFSQGSTGSSDGLSIETSQIERRDISRIVSSSGAIAPLITVEVGSQLSGQLLEVNKDFNDQVTEGELIARIDPQTFQTRVSEAEAALEVAQAQVAVSAANVTRANAGLREAERAFARAQELLERGTYSEVQYDAADTARESAIADVRVAEANLRNARAAQAQREASLTSARVDLERTFIRSPINGVIIDRQVDVGQTVAASFSAPILFLIAQDLSRIQIEAQVDEADIGAVAVGQPVTFDVDAYPDREFSGEVRQVRLAATTALSVVTYTVVIEADNPGQRLLPGMTANVNIVTGEVTDVLTAPNAALRFQPRGAAEALVDAAAGSGGGGGSGRPGGGTDAMLDRLAEQLEMTEDQKAEARTALTAAFAQLRAQMQGGGAPGATGGGRPDFQGIMQRALRDVLTADQMTRLAELQAESASGREEVRRGTIWLETEGGRLRSQPVGLGLSDGQYTQILGEGLAEGTAVVTRVREGG